ncbi:MAG TPA: UvrD-helicase domain-containing protein [Thermodesulfovibrionales bacterium]|nr:UvrD-helicase domain-containing protein [Thermodesulfovibrionales bacterium]
MMYTSKEMSMHDLNPQQKEAQTYTDGPLLVFAGAGSGKTRVISHKFSYLNRTKKIPRDSIFTVTFTNKAADEMKERISDLIEKDVSGCWIGTFHSQCNRILRKEIKSLGYDNNFSVYDEDDQYNLIRHILKEFKIYEALYKGIVSRIGFLKSSLITPEDFLSSGDGFGFDEKLAKVYVRYQDELKRSNSLDFDDLIMLTAKLFEKNPKLLERYQEKFSYILVDEFQDTNYAQYHLMKILASGHKKICVVGDDDQSIYRFRGANVNNILNFAKDFPGAKVIKLEQNYRSTQHILQVSGAVIEKNPVRKEKQLWTDKGAGDKVHFCWLNTYEDEAKYIAKAIKEYYLKGMYTYRDFAVFFRVGLQSRVIEDALRDQGLPYRVIGSISFYQRKEIKDIIAYLRLFLNHGDNVSFRRVINSPQRGIGAATIAKIENEAKKRSQPLFDALKSTLRGDHYAPAVKEKLSEFVKIIEGFGAGKHKSAADLLKSIYEMSGYAGELEEERQKNIEELISSAENKEIKDFVDRISLISHVDQDCSGDCVTLMTLHNAKGLEFPVVFITGLEEGVLPYCKALNHEDEIAEERRLFYVGMTRAREVLWLTGAKKRKLYSKVQEQEPCRFLKDIPKEYCQWMEKITFSHPVKLVPIKKKVELSDTFTVYTAGCRVKHPSWGIGVVRDCYGDGDDAKVMVNFPNIGVKRLAVRFANLEKI